MISKIKSRFKNKDNKSLLENFLSLSALQVFSIILPLITLPYVLRVIGVSNYGVIVLANSLIAYFTSVTDYSFRITATRDVAVFNSSKKKLDIIYSRVLMVKFLLLLFSVSVISLIISLYEPFYEEKLVFYLTLPMLLGYTIFPEWFFQGIEKMRYITFLNLGVKLLFTICIFIFINEAKDYWLYPLLQSLGFVGSGVIAQVILIRKYKLRFIWLKPKRITKTLKDNYPVFVNQFLPTLYNNTSTFLLGILTNTSLVGTYDAIKKVTDLSITMIGVISRTFFPFLNRNNSAFNKYKSLMLSIGLILTSLPILFSKVIFWYLDMSYDQSFYVLLTLSIGIIGFALYDIFGLNFFLVKREDRLVMKNTFNASIIGFFLSFPLIMIFGIVGAALNLSFTRLYMGLSLLLKYNKYDAKNLK